MTAPPFLAIDPGLDLAGWALYEPGQVPLMGITLEERAGPALVAYGRLVTKPGTPIATRLGQLTRGMHDLVVAEHRPLEVVIEMPADVALYARNAGARLRQLFRQLSKLHMAIGALQGGAELAGGTVHLLRTPRTKKAQKQDIARRVLARWDPRGRPVRSTVEDERDAIYLGAHYLLERRAALLAEVA